MTRRAAVALALALSLVSCAPLATPPASAPAPPVATPGTTPAPVNRPAVVDTVPSADAQRVLATIPEPLAGAERVPPPPRSAVVPDSLHPVDPAAVDSVDAGLPVPAPTRPLGEVRDTTAVPSSPPSSPPPSSPPPASPPPAAPPAAADTCWRVQFVAPDLRERAESLRAAAESVLLTGVVVEPEGGLYKVRSAGCTTRAAADALRARARASGFPDAFRFQGHRP